MPLILVAGVVIAKPVAEAFPDRGRPIRLRLPGVGYSAGDARRRSLAR